MITMSSRPAVVRSAAALLAAVLALLVVATPAWAHNTLRSASPAREATLPGTPTEITLEFMQRLDPTLTTIVLTGRGKQRIPTGDPVVVGARSTVAVTGTLPNGTYTVAYRVVSADGHPVQGSYPFTVADPAASAAPSEQPAAGAAGPAAPVASDDSQGTGVGLGVAGGAAVVLLAGSVLAGAVGVLRWRRRSRRP
ncbi:copper resistance CopC family protein [Micromonospora rifamycinica]|uniref:copper resistance CopC family protein n=1 Tax=Micromonospora rifamycinica TaxID=291594 RepID=UPI0033EA9DA4